MKHCNKCGNDKPLTDFSKDRTRHDGHSNKCKTCATGYKKQWVLDNPVDPEYNKKACKTYRDRHPEKKAEINKQWREDNPAHISMLRQKRRALENNAEGSHTSNDIARLQSSGFCAYCNDEIETGHIDHIVPLAKGGRNDASNLAFSCPSCNTSKHATLLELWITSQPFTLGEVVDRIQKQHSN